MQNRSKKVGKNLFDRVKQTSERLGEEGVEHVKENFIDRLAHVKMVRLLVLEWSLLVFAIIFFAITQAFWYTSSYATEVFSDGGTYTEGTLGTVNSLNPLFASTSSEKTLSKLLFATLSITDYSGHTGLGLAKSITHDEAAKVWTVVLKNDLKWSDGESLSPDDVIFTANLIKNPSLNTNFSGSLTGVTVKSLSDEEIKTVFCTPKEGEAVTRQNCAEYYAGGVLNFELSTANVFFESALDFPILPEHILKNVSPELILENGYSSKPSVTSGPFSYNATQLVGNKGEQVVYLTANANYYKGEPLLGSFAVHAYLDTNALTSALNSGSITATADLTSRDSNAAKKENETVTNADGNEVAKQYVTSDAMSERQTALSYGTFAFLNTKSEYLKDKSLRQALQMGIDMSKVREVLHGEPALDFPLISSQIDLKFPSLPALDKTKAVDLVAGFLQKGGYGSGDKPLPEINIATVRSGYLPEIAEKLADEIRSIGLNAAVNVYDVTSDFTVNVLSPRNYDILVYEIGLGPDPDVFAYYHSSEANASGHNLSSYTNTIVSDLLLSARSTVDDSARKTKYEKFLERWVEDVPALGIFQTNLSYYVNTNVRTFSEDNKLVYATDRFTDINHWGATKTTKNRTP